MNEEAAAAVVFIEASSVDADDVLIESSTVNRSIWWITSNTVSSDSMLPRAACNVPVVLPVTTSKSLCRMRMM